MCLAEIQIHHIFDGSGSFGSSTKKNRYIFKYASGKSIDIASNNRTPELGRHIAKLLHNNMETFFVI